MGLKQSVVGNTLGEHIGNPWGTYWEPNENPLELEGYMLGTKENWKKILPRVSPLHPKLRKNKIKAL
jgi:hypothetical protein